MSINFKQTIIHNLDLNMGQPLISKELTVLTDEIESFITRKIFKVLEGQGICEGTFKEQMSLYEDDQLYSVVKKWEPGKFKRLSEVLANVFYRYIVEYGTISSGDLVVTNYLMDGKEYLAILKLNFNSGSHTHYYSHEEEAMKLVTNKSIYSDKVTEAAIICIDEVSIQLLDETKCKYLQLLLDVDTKLSVKEKLKAIDKVATKVIEEHYDNPIKALNDLKANISESLARTNSINVAEVVEQTFGEDEEVLECCKNHLKEFGLNEEQTIKVTGSKLFNKYSNQKLKTDTGIEIKMPTHLFKDKDFFEIIEEHNGTQTLIIKNVSQVLNK